MCHPANQVKVAHVQSAARTSVWQEYTSSEAKGAYWWILSDKPDNVVCMMYEKFSSLSIFANGSQKHEKIQQLNRLASDYGVDLLSGCKTRTGGILSQMKRANSATFLGMDNLLEDLVLSILTMGRSNRISGGGPV